MATEMTPQEQKHLVYEGITAVAARCDGAISLDMKGFDGVDTHYGRRVALVPEAQWTDDVTWECARISNKYREQILRWTGIDVTTIPLVQEAVASGRSTNYAARDQARAYEKRAKHLSARVIDAFNGRLTVAWANGDPDFDSFLKLVRDLPGRRWDSARRVNVVDVSPQVEVFVNEYDFTMTPAAQALLEARKVALPSGPQVDVQARPEGSYPVYLLDGRVIIKTNLTAPGQPAADAVRSLPGRSFVRSLYANSANATPQVLAFASHFGLEVSPAAKRACEAAGAALQATQGDVLAQGDVDTVLNAVSRCGSPEDLPAVFVTMLKEILP